jgi:hypothetical protein
VYYLVGAKRFQKPAIAQQQGGPPTHLIDCHPNAIKAHSCRNEAEPHPQSWKSRDLAPFRQLTAAPATRNEMNFHSLRT